MMWWTAPARGIERHRVVRPRREKVYCLSASQQMTRMAQSGHSNRTSECPRLGVKRT